MTGTGQRYVYRKLSDLEPFRSVCGMRQSILNPEDGGECGLSRMAIADSRKHYHQTTTEVYYILEGEGEMELGDDVVKLEPGVTILIPPGIRHTAKGDVKTLIFSVPPGETTDVHFDPEDE